MLGHLRGKNSGALLCHRIKLMCVGQANVGKTSLVEKLLSKSVTKPTEPESGVRAVLRPDEDEEGGKLRDSQRNRRWSYSEVEHGKLSLISSGGAEQRGEGWADDRKKRGRATKKVDMATDGIRIREWTAKSVSRKDVSKEKEKSKDINSNIITFSTWDFAGQELYYYTHLFFLSRRGIYLLIFNLLKPEEEASRIEYWLQSIHTRARGERFLICLSSPGGMAGLTLSLSFLQVLPSFLWELISMPRNAQRNIWITFMRTCCKSSAASSRTFDSSLLSAVQQAREWRTYERSLSKSPRT